MYEPHRCFFLFDSTLFNIEQNYCCCCCDIIDTEETLKTQDEVWDKYFKGEK